MIYTIRRTSDWQGENKPCKKAQFKGVGKFKYNIYTIEINSLEELQALINEVGKIVIDKDTIEIYDDYRE